MTVTFDETQTTRDWLGSFASWSSLTTDDQAGRFDDSGGMGVSQGGDDSHKESRHQFAGISEEDITLFVERAILRMDPAPAMRVYLESEDGQDFFRTVILKGVKDFGTQRLVRDYFATSEGKEHVRKLFMSHSTVVHGADTAKRPGTGEDTPADKVVAKEGLVRQRSRFGNLWSLVVGITLGFGLNWFVDSTSLPGIESTLMRGLYYFAAEVNSVWRLVGVCVVVVVLVGGLLRRSSRECGRHRR